MKSLPDYKNAYQALIKMGTNGVHGLVSFQRLPELDAGGVLNKVAPISSCAKKFLFCFFVFLSCTKGSGGFLLNSLLAVCELT